MHFDISPYLRDAFDPRSAMHCNLTFTCENNTKIFYKIMKDCSYYIEFNLESLKDDIKSERKMKSPYPG